MAQTRVGVRLRPVTHLINVFGDAFLAYSLRKINSDYNGPIIRVRRSSDNTETNIGLVNDILDTVSLLNFVGSSDGHVVTWFDQSGNGRDINQTQATNQPKIVKSGVLVTSTNGLPSIETDGNDYFTNTGFVNKVNNFTYSIVIDVPNLTTNHAICATGSNGTQMWYSRTNGNDRNYDNVPITAPKLSIGSHLITMSVDGVNAFQSINSVWEDGQPLLLNFNGSNNSDSNFWLFSRAGASGLSPNGVKLQEFIYFDLSLTSNMDNLNTELNNYYTIY